MPTEQLAVTTTSQKLIRYNSERTALALVNMDDTDKTYISDDGPVSATNGFLLYPKTYITLDRERGWNPQKAYHLIGDASHSVGMFEAFGEAEDIKKAKDLKVSPQEPGRY